jgi:hypothetical protein
MQGFCSSARDDAVSVAILGAGRTASDADIYIGAHWELMRRKDLALPRGISASATSLQTSLRDATVPMHDMEHMVGPYEYDGAVLC